MSPEIQPSRIQFQIECRGRDRLGQKVLPVPVDAIITISHYGNIISTEVDCIYATGAHQQRCKTEDPTKDKIGKGASCVYVCDLPYALEKFK